MVHYDLKSTTKLFGYYLVLNSEKNKITTPVLIIQLKNNLFKD